MLLIDANAYLSERRSCRLGEVHGHSRARTALRASVDRNGVAGRNTRFERPA
jgi:hypothetical protein